LAFETEKLFNATMANLDGMNPLPTNYDYVETMRLLLWDIAFFCEFAVDKGAQKNHKIKKQLNFEPAM
jgi:hypothetical protein